MSVVADGHPLCKPCLDGILVSMSTFPVLSRDDGTPADLDECPGCGATREEALGSEPVCCPSCYASFRVALRRQIAALSP
jgi:hypothetical protein